MCPSPQKPASVFLLLRLSHSVSYYGSRFVQAILCSFQVFLREMREGRMAGKVKGKKAKGKIVTLAKRK
jgi:hypothetical protein